jgi:hypothetical protein
MAARGLSRSGNWDLTGLDLAHSGCQRRQRGRPGEKRVCWMEERDRPGKQRKGEKVRLVNACESVFDVREQGSQTGSTRPFWTADVHSMYEASPPPRGTPKIPASFFLFRGIAAAPCPVLCVLSSGSSPSLRGSGCTLLLNTLRTTKRGRQTPMARPPDWNAITLIHIVMSIARGWRTKRPASGEKGRVASTTQALSSRAALGPCTC